MLLAVGLAGCVGENPDWDGPDRGVASAAEDGSGASEGEAESGSDSGETLDADATSDTGAATTQGSSSDGAPVCEAGQAICAGECTDIATDKNACGSDCVDCTVEFGNGARCRESVCGPKEED